MENDFINYIPTDGLEEFMLLHAITSLLFLIEIAKEELLVMDGITADIVLEIYYLRDAGLDKK